MPLGPTFFIIRLGLPDAAVEMSGRRRLLAGPSGRCPASNRHIAAEFGEGRHAVSRDERDKYILFTTEGC